VIFRQVLFRQVFSSVPGRHASPENAGTAQLAFAARVTHLMAMSNDDIYVRKPAHARGAAGAAFGGAEPRGPVIDQEGREIPQESLGPSVRSSLGGRFQTFRFDFGHSGANPFGDLTREQRLARLDAIARLLDVAFVLPGTNVRYGIDGIIRLIPVVGDLIASAFSLWLVREARTLGAPWHVTGRMLANVALEGTVGMVPIAGDAFDVLFRANIRNMRILRRWMERQPR
jgi:hypothetical protein